MSHNRFPLLLALVSVASAQAEPGPALDRFSLSAGVFNASLDTRIRAEAADRFDNRVDFERDLDLDRRQPLMRFAGHLLLGDRHQFGLEYFRVSRSAGTVIDREFDFGGEIFRIDTPVNARLRLSTASLTYTYWAYSGDHTAFGVSAGALFYRVEADLRADRLPGSSGSIGTSAAAEGRVPVPQIGLAWRRNLGSRWRLGIDASAFQTRSGRVRGRVYDLRAGIEYFPTTHFGLFVELCDTRLDAETRRTPLNGELDLAFRGVRMGLKLRG